MGVGPPGMGRVGRQAVGGCEAVSVLVLGLCASRCVGLSVLSAQGCVRTSYISGLGGGIVKSPTRVLDMGPVQVWLAWAVYHAGC